MRSAAYRIGRVWKNNDAWAALVSITFDGVHIEVGAYCSGMNCLPTMFLVFASMLRDMFSVNHSATIIWSCDNNPEAATVMKIQGLDPIFEDGIQLACGRATNLSTGKPASVKVPHVIMSSIVCAGVSSKNVHYSDKDQCLANRTGGTGETWDYMYRFLKTDNARKRVQLVLGEIGTGFETSEESMQSCLTMASGQMGSLGFVTSKYACDCKSFGSRQRRRRLHMKWSKNTLASNRSLYLEIMEAFKVEEAPPVQDFLERFSAVRHDPFLNRPWTRKAKYQKGSASGDLECSQCMNLHGQQFPPTYHEDPPAEFFGLPSDVRVLGMGCPDSLQRREYNVAFCKLACERFFENHPSSEIIFMSLDRSLARWSKDMVGICGTIDPHSKLYLLRRQPASERSLRPVLIKELCRLQGFQLTEMFSNPAQLSRLVKQISYRQMVKLLGNGYHMGVEMCHYAASMISCSRIDTSDGAGLFLITFKLTCSITRIWELGPANYPLPGQEL